MRDDARAVLQSGSSRRVGVAAGVTGGHFVETKWPASDAPIAGSPRGASTVPRHDPRVPGQSQPGPGPRRRGQHRGVHRGDQGVAQRTDVAGCHQLVVPRHGECSILSIEAPLPLPVFPDLSRSPVHGLFPPRARNVTMKPGQQILPTGDATRRRTPPPRGPQME